MDERRGGGPAAGRRGQRAVAVLTAGLLLLVACVCWERASHFRSAHPENSYDFHHFYLDARYAFEHRGTLNPDLDGPDPLARRQLPFYLPAVTLLISPLAAGGPLVAAVLWTAMQVAALAVTIGLLRRWLPVDGGNVLAAALLLALAAIYEAARFNQLGFLVLALVLGGLSALERRRCWAAGALLAAAAVIKLLPALLLPWLLLKRQWRAAGAFVLVAAALAFGPSLIAWPPRQALEYHRQWWRYNVGGAASTGLASAAQRDHFLDHRNQSIAAVLGRLTWPDHPFRLSWQPLSLTREQGAAASRGISALLLACLFWATRRPASREDLAQPNEQDIENASSRTMTDSPRQPTEIVRVLRGELGAYLLMMVVLSPLVRTYYLVWALPALVLMGAVAAQRGAGRGWAAAGLLIWLAGMAAWPFETARLIGVHTGMLAAIAGCLLAAVSQRRKIQTAPRPHAE